MATPQADDTDRLRPGDAREQLLQRLVDRLSSRLRRMVKLRLDRRLQGRVDPSDVLQEAYLEAAERIGDYCQNPTMPPYLWLRFITGQRLLRIHRQHLGVQA